MARAFRVLQTHLACHQLTFSHYLKTRQYKQGDQLGPVLRHPMENALCVAEQTLDHAERMLDFDSFLSFGLLDLKNHASQQAAFVE